MLNTELIFREAKAQDLDSIVQFQVAMAMETEKLALDAQTCALGVRAVIDNPSLGKYFVAAREGEVVGSLLVVREWSDWRNRMVWWIHSVYLVPSERGKGTFSKFYQFILERGRTDENIRGLRLYVDKTNQSAQRVYQGLGMSNQHYELYEWMES